MFAAQTGSGLRPRRQSCRKSGKQSPEPAATTGSVPGHALALHLEAKAMLKIGIIIGSTRPGRNGEAVAKWVYELAQKRSDAELELVDLATFELPLLDEPAPPSTAQYIRPHTRAWSAKIASFDGYVFVTPEYNHGPSGALKNAIDFLHNEWINKAAAFVGYGGTSGARAIEQLRLVMGALQVATVTAQVGLSMFTDFEKFSVFKPAAIHEQNVHRMLDQLVAWSGALGALRKPGVRLGP
jgi:NAD(P)H-dependent FMN reductase